MTRAIAVLVLSAAVTSLPPVGAQDLPDEGVRVTSLASAEVLLSGDLEPVVRPAFEVEVDGPLALGAGAPARVYTRFRLFGLPGQSAVDPTDFESVRAAELALGAYVRVGRLQLGDQDVWTSLEGEWGFATLTGETAAAGRYPRHYALGIRIEERRLGAWLAMLYGRHESAGPRGWGQWMIAGAVPLSLTRGAVVLGGDAVLSVGPADPLGARRDVFRLFVGVDPAQVAALFRR